MAEERLIRKYANRRLYDAQDSRHVTLDDLRKLIAGGQRIKVVDDKSGADITRSVLLHHRQPGAVRNPGAEPAAARGHHSLLRQSDPADADVVPGAEHR